MPIYIYMVVLGMSINYLARQGWMPVTRQLVLAGGVGHRFYHLNDSSLERFSTLSIYIYIYMYINFCWDFLFLSAYLMAMCMYLSTCNSKCYHLMQIFEVWAIELELSLYACTFHLLGPSERSWCCMEIERYNIWIVGLGSIIVECHSNFASGC